MLFFFLRLLPPTRLDQYSRLPRLPSCYSPHHHNDNDDDDDGDDDGDDDIYVMVKCLCVCVSQKWLLLKGFGRFPVSRHFQNSVTPPLPYSKDFVVSPISRHFPYSNLTWTPWLGSHESSEYQPWAIIVHTIDILWPLVLLEPTFKNPPAWRVSSNKSEDLKGIWCKGGWDLVRTPSWPSRPSAFWIEDLAGLNLRSNNRAFWTGQKMG